MFSIINTKTKKVYYPNTEEWYKLLSRWGRKYRMMTMDMEGFAIAENGQIIILDECGGMNYLPTYFKVYSIRLK